MDFKPRLMAFDLDGTLAESKSPMTAEMGQTMARLLEAMPAAVLSGASFAQFETQLLPGFPKDSKFENLYLFPANASVGYRFKEGTWQQDYSEAITPEEDAEIMRAFDVAMKKTGFDVPPAQVWGDRIENRGSQITFSALGQNAPIAEKKAWDPTREKRRPLYDELVALLPNYAIGLNATTSIDITHKGVNKAYGITKLVELTGIPVASMLYVGDALMSGGNDSVVIPTGVPTHAVTGPDETKAVIEEVLA